MSATERLEECSYRQRPSTIGSRLAAIEYAHRVDWRAVPANPRPSEVALRFSIADLRSAMHPVVMQHAMLVGFLAGSLPAEVLADEITAEVAAYNAACKAGKIGQIVITGGPPFDVTREGTRRLLTAVAEQRLLFELANYVGDCIIMSDDFDFADEVVGEAVYLIADDSRPPTRDETAKALMLLG